MSPSKYIADRFEKILETVRENGGNAQLLPDYDRAIFHLICIRCEIDINGFESVFDQLLTEDDLLFSIEALAKIESYELAGSFRQVHIQLRSIGFYEDPTISLDEHRLPDGSGMLDKYEATIVKDQELWEIDAKLLELIPFTSR
jgi:hypothetical protein